MMAPRAGGRPGSSRRVRLVPVRRSGMDHRAVARIVLALARQMATETDDAVSSGAGTCARREPGTSDEQAAARDDAAVPWAGAHSGQSARGVASVGRCAAERLPSCRHTSVHHSPHEAAAASSTPGGAP